MKLKALCFFEETPYGNCGSIYEAKRDEAHAYKEKIISYLSSGVVCAAAFGLIKDIISGEVIGPQSMLTDGFWVWGSDLSTYVKKYNVELPEDFIAQVKQWDEQSFDVDLSSVEL